jgi:diguanylate cyclase (GGDEF)-like protein
MSGEIDLDYTEDSNILATETNSILIIDSDSANQVFLSSLLTPDYVVHIAADGRSGIKKAKEIIPDLILLDNIMPGMSGYDVLAALRSIEMTRDIPVIITSELSSAEDEQKGLASDAVDYIGKPFVKEIVKLRVRNHIKIINQMRIISCLNSTDQLTKIPNRRGFDNQINREWGRSIREKAPISVLMIDVDKFKDYNDEYGHQQGDAALVEAASAIERSLGRSTDYAARWGGEEFIALLPSTDLKGALDVAERIRSCIEQTDIPLVGGGNTRITVSVGVNTLIPSIGDAVYDFISAADKALYNAKDSGRNKVCCNII